MIRLVSTRLIMHFPVPRTDPPTILVEYVSDGLKSTAGVASVTLRFVAEGDDWRCTGLEVSREAQELSPATMGALARDWPDILWMCRAHAKMEFRQSGQHARVLTARMRSRRKLDDDFFRQIAQEYRAQGGRGTTRAIANAHGVGRSTAALWIHRAREKGFLGPALPGKPGEAHEPHPTRPEES